MLEVFAVKFKRYLSATEEIGVAVRAENKNTVIIDSEGLRPEVYSWNFLRESGCMTVNTELE